MARRPPPKVGDQPDGAGLRGEEPRRAGQQ
jgi:hypothetical protein